MKWVKIPSKGFKYNGKHVKRKKVVAKTIFGDFEVFESVGGNWFFRHPFLKSDYISDLSILGGQFKGTFFDNGTEEWFGKSKKPCKDLQEGIKICNDVMNKLKNIVVTY